MLSKAPHGISSLKLNGAQVFDEALGGWSERAIHPSDNLNWQEMEINVDVQSLQTPDLCALHKKRHMNDRNDAADSSIFVLHDIDSTLTLTSNDRDPRARNSDSAG